MMSSLMEVSTPEEGLKRLKQGNQRFAEEALLRFDCTKARRLSLLQKQFPYAVVITCADSRVIPEVIFDEGLGNLFVVRVAGNVMGKVELESIEFAIQAFDPLVMVVMGHENCGAVKAVIKKQTQNIPTVAHLIEPSVEKAKCLHSKDLLQLSIKFNAFNMCEWLLKSKVIEKKVQAKGLLLCSAYYHIKTGRVEFLKASSFL